MEGLKEALSPSSFSTRPAAKVDFKDEEKKPETWEKELFFKL